MKTVKLSEVVPKNTTKVIVEDTKNDKVEVVNKKDLEKKKINPQNSRIVPFQQDLIDGASVAERYLQKEFPLMLNFFKDRGVDPTINYEFDTPGEYWMQLDFPLPKYAFYEKDGKIVKYKFPNSIEPIVIVLNGYPDIPPIGFFIEKESPNKKVFQEVFKDHLFDKPFFSNKNVKEFFKDNWHWICFHYENFEWNFNRFDITKGDTLTSYLYAMFYKLTKLEGISHA